MWFRSYNNEIKYHSKINVIFVDLPIFRRIHGDNGSVSTTIYDDIEQWMNTINHYIEQGCNTMYLYDFYNKEDTIIGELLFVRQAFFTEI